MQSAPEPVQSPTPSPSVPRPRLTPARRVVGRTIAAIIMFVILVVGAGAGAIIGAQSEEEIGIYIGILIGFFVSQLVLRASAPGMNRLLVRLLCPRIRPATAAPSGASALSAEDARGLALACVTAQQQATCPPSSRESTSYDGQNYARAGQRGFALAAGVLRETAPSAGESPCEYLDRVKDRVRQLRDEYRDDDSDADGACGGALDAALSAINNVWVEMPG